MENKLIHSVIQPVVIKGDCSVSMDEASNPNYNPPIVDLNSALEQFYKDVQDVEHFEVHTMYIRFSHYAEVLQGFQAAGVSPPPTYTTFGNGTDYGAAIGLGIAELHEYRAELHDSGLEVNQPWIVFLSDGKPNLNSNPGYEVELLSLIERDKLVFIPVAIGGSEALDSMVRLSPKLKPIIVGSDGADSLSFKEFFRWLSDSVQAGEFGPLAQNDEARDDANS